MVTYTALLDQPVKKTPAELARVSPGYLSELERGRKEVSSELLAAVCRALGANVSDVLIEAAGSMAMQHSDSELAAL